MKHVITALIATGLLAIATAGHAQEFNSQELNISVFAGDLGKEDSDFMPGIGVSYFPTRHIGFGASTHWEEFDGKLIDNLAAEAYFRWPLSAVPIAPYAVATGGYSFETEEPFFSIGGGAEWRFNSKWGIFGDVRYQINDDTDNGTAFRLGVKLTF